MNAAIAKQKTIEIQYDAIKKKIDEHLENECVDAKVSIDMMLVPLDETIELILLDGFDVIITTKEDNDQKKPVLYEVSWKNAVYGKEGRIKYVSVEDEFAKFSNFVENLGLAMFPINFGCGLDDYSEEQEFENEDIEQYDTTDDEEGFEHYFK